MQIPNIIPMKKTSNIDNTSDVKSIIKNLYVDDITDTPKRNRIAI